MNHPLGKKVCNIFVKIVLEYVCIFLNLIILDVNGLKGKRKIEEAAISLMPCPEKRNLPPKPDCELVTNYCLKIIKYNIFSTNNHHNSKKYRHSRIKMSLI